MVGGRVVPPLHRLAGALIVCAVILGLVLPGEEHSAPARTKSARAAAAERPAATPSARPTLDGTPPHASAQPIGPATATARQAKANELGQVPVFMYHRIVAKTQASLDRTPKELRDELVRLAKEGYAPITAAEFARGWIDVPAGKHPVVLTFDDGSPGQFGLDAQGNPKPDTAVAILMDVARQHPGFRPVATFYVNQQPFQLGEQAAAGLRWLVQRGFEIGNHTYTHPDLAQLSKNEVQREIGRDEAQILALSGAHAVTLAYPFGSPPERASWARRKGGEYDFQGIFLAGWRPSVSPFGTDFDPEAITRVRSEGKITENDCKLYCSAAWLDWLGRHPGERYVSDGDPRTISVPASTAKDLSSRYRVYGRSY